jgi:hypothetical protein
MIKIEENKERPQKYSTKSHETSFPVKLIDNFFNHSKNSHY